MKSHPKTFVGSLIRSFLEIQGPLLWLVTFALAILFRIFPLNKTISLDWAIPAFLALLVIILTVGKAGYELFNSSSKGLPRPIIIKESRTVDAPPTFLCLLEASELFSYGIMVSFYYDDGDFEALIGLGIVEHIREDKRIQVRIVAPASGYEEIMERFKRNEAQVIKNVTVKPHVPQSYLTLPPTATS